MQKLQISYVTWTRSDANGLFDYEDLKDKPADKSIMIEHGGYICRRKGDYKIQFSQSKEVDEQMFQKILKVSKKDNHYVLYSLNISNEPLFKIIEQEFPKTHELKKGDTVRLGKVVVQVLKIEFNMKKKISQYAKIKQQMQFNQLSAVRQITPSFYQKAETKPIIFQSQQTSLYSCIEQNPSCRYCYSKTVAKDNPFILGCSCKGSGKFVHESCLLEWALRRGVLQTRQLKSGILFAQQKVFKCELCHQFFYIPDLWRKFFDYQKKHQQKQNQNQQNLLENAFQEVLILHVKYQTNWLYFIDLSEKRSVTIGRSLDNDIILNQLSVSRQHARLEIDSIDKVITLSNNNAKFGTLVQIKNVEVQHDESYQVGRTKMSFKKHQKRSLLDKIGLFCFVKQKLHKQIPKNNRNSKMEMDEREKVKTSFQPKTQFIQQVGNLQNLE